MNTEKAGILLLEIFSNGNPAFSVPEYSEIELRVSNTGSFLLAGCRLLAGSLVIKDGMDLPPAMIWSVPFSVGDLAGELGFKVVNREGTEAALVTIQVIPQKLRLEEILYIKTARLPYLLSKLQAPNGLSLRYTYSESYFEIFNFFSADYSAEKLLYFSRALLEEGTTSAILEQLDYRTPEIRKSSLETIRGKILWPETSRSWSNRPEEAGLRHEWGEAPRNYSTLPNLLFVSFHNTLEDEFKKLVKFVDAGNPASSNLKKNLDLLTRRACLHKDAWVSPLLPSLPQAGIQNFGYSEHLENFEAEFGRAAQLNSAFGQLYNLWLDFNGRYISLPVENETAAWSGLQPTAKIYELWAVCEIAAALGLLFFSTQSYKGQPVLNAGGAFFCSPDQKIKLYYNREVNGGWYSGERTGLPRPDLRIDWNGKVILLDIKYRVGTDFAAQFDDSYKMLAYMNDFNVECGAIIFPGKEAGTGAVRIEGKNGQNLFEISLRPVEVENQPEFQQKLGEIVNTLIL